MADRYLNQQVRLSDPAGGGFAIVPADGADLSIAARAIYVGSGGNVRVITVEGSDITFKNAVSGSILPIRAARVYATGTSAADLIGLV